MKLLFYFFCSFLIFTSGIESLSKAYSSENKSLNIGLIIPLSGEYEEIGKSVLKSIRMGLNKINNKNIILLISSPPQLVVFLMPLWQDRLPTMLLLIRLIKLHLKLGVLVLKR